MARAHDEQAVARWLSQDWPRITRKARRRSSCLVLLDDSGLLARCCVAVGSCRVTHPSKEYKSGHREKVSVAAALWLTPKWDRLQLAYQTLVNGYFSTDEVANFLSGAMQGLSVW